MTDIMRIAHFSNTYKPDINGVARSVSTFREGLSRMGHHVFVFAQEAPQCKGKSANSCYGCTAPGCNH